MMETLERIEHDLRDWGQARSDLLGDGPVRELATICDRMMLLRLPPTGDKATW